MYLSFQLKYFRTDQTGQCGNQLRYLSPSKSQNQKRKASSKEWKATSLIKYNLQYVVITVLYSSHKRLLLSTWLHHIINKWQKGWYQKPRNSNSSATLWLVNTMLEASESLTNVNAFLFVRFQRIWLFSRLHDNQQFVTQKSPKLKFFLNYNLFCSLSAYISFRGSQVQTFWLATRKVEQ